MDQDLSCLMKESSQLGRACPVIQSLFEKARWARIPNRPRSIKAHAEQDRIYELDTLRRSQNPTVVVTANGEVHTNEIAQVDVHDLLIFLKFANALRGAWMFECVGQRSKNHGWPKRRRYLFAIRTTSYLLLFEGCPPELGANSSSTSTSQDFCLQQVQLKSEVTNKPQEKGADPFKQKPTTKIKREMSVEMLTTVWVRSFWMVGGVHRLSGGHKKCMHPHTVLGNQLHKIPRKWSQNQGSTVLILTSQKTEIAKSAFEPKWQGVFAEDALAKQYLEHKSLVTW